MSITSASLSDCAEVLKKHRNAPKDGNISDDDLINLFNSKDIDSKIMFKRKTKYK